MSGPLIPFPFLEFGTCMREGQVSSPLSLHGAGASLPAGHSSREPFLNFPAPAPLPLRWLLGGLGEGWTSPRKAPRAGGGLPQGRPVLGCIHDPSVCSPFQSNCYISPSCFCCASWSVLRSPYPGLSSPPNTPLCSGQGHQ